MNEKCHQREIWITWEYQRRNVGISNYFNMELYEIVYDHKNIFYRYLLCIYKTLNLLSKKPKLVCVQNPSMVLSLIAIFIKPLYKYRLVVDTHNSGIFPKTKFKKICNVIFKYIQKKSDLTIVTNYYLENIVNQNGGNAKVLPDKIPSFVDTAALNLKLPIGKIVVFICTFDIDEPYDEVIKSARYIEKSVKIIITGNYIGKVNTNQISRNVFLTGYLQENLYWLLLKKADIVMDLTTRDHCLVCGAYEALSVNKPLILSNTQVNRNFFYKGCVYVDSDHQSIAKGIKRALTIQDKLEQDIFHLKKDLLWKWEEQATYVKKVIDNL